MILISMTDFVLEIGKQTEVKTYAWYFLKVTKYANFLKQPLTLDMFIPCDDKGNVLKYETEYCLAKKGSERFERHVNYWKAKEKVLFEGFMLDEFGLSTKYWVISILEDVEDICDYTIEDLVGYNLTLTPYAIKQLGL